MKKYLVFASLFLFSIHLANAQDTTMRHQNTQGKAKSAKMDNKKKNKSDKATTNAAGQINSETNTGVAGTDDGSVQLTSTGRYAAMGVQMGSLHRKDMKFLFMANSSNMLELQLSQMALEKASNAAVRDYASMMVQHHSKAGEEMKKLLSSKGALIPDTAMMTRHRMRMEMLSEKQGAEFDKAYIRIMVDAHEEDLDEYEDETTDARDADIRSMTARMLPTLRMHYDRARELRKQL